MFTKMKKNNEGFALVEIILTMIVLGMITIIAMPKLAESIELADKTNIQNDIRVAEDLSILHIYENDFKVRGEEKVDKNLLLAAVEDERVYDLRGLTLDSDRISKNTYFKLDNQFVEEELGSQLDGDFIVTENADVLYIENIDTNKDQSHMLADNIVNKLESIVSENKDARDEISKIDEMDSKILSSTFR